MYIDLQCIFAFPACIIPSKARLCLGSIRDFSCMVVFGVG